MKKNNFSKFLMLSVFLAFTFHARAQKNVDLKKIKGKYNQEKLTSIEKNLKSKSTLLKKEAIKIAKEKGWKTKFTNKKGELLEIQKVVNGKPIYYTTFNVAAAKSTRTDHLNSGGSLGLNLMGQNMTAHVWDGGLARTSHQEYDGAGGTNRFSIGDGTTTLHYHSAHVTGTIIASGVVANAKGMAPHASAVGYDWNSDTSEATNAASNGMLVSNHSYGFAARNPNTGQPWLPDYYFGGYIEDSRDWDNIMFNAPNYLMVVAAGNDGNDNSANGAPLDGNSSYDKLSGHATSKNSLVVANANDANIDSNGVLISVNINSSSSEGPTDDYRIKPDITGNGTSVYSTYESSDTAYNSITGTSMASPNVAGTLLILQQHANNVRGSFIKASTLKGIALHTADDAGANGPDAIYGWGLMNAKRAAEAITQNGNESKIEELTLTNGQSYQITVDSDGVNNLMASISWTDRAGTATTTANSNNPVLVNDLDIRVSKSGTTYTPWKLTGVTTNGKGDNNVDPFEKVDIANASGTYTITISHKGTLTGGSQNYSLIVTGLTGTPVVCNATIPSNTTIDGFGSSTATVSWDAVPGSSYDFRYRQTGTTSWTTSSENGTSKSLTGLTPQTSYEVQVRSKCPDNSTSSYSSSVSFTTTEVQLNYCDSNGNNVSDEYISNVSIGNINNSSGASSSGYADYTSQSTNLTKGTSSTITITPTWTGTLYNEGYAVFIDYNKDGDFSDSGETIWTQAASQTTPVSGTFTVPTSAITGATRMRVVMQYNAIPTSCGTYNYGETEDYTVNISGGVPDTTAPVITLNGSPTINLTQGDTYNELGATATDNVDGNLTSSIVISGTVNTSTVGTYTINYNVSDAAGNAATQVSRTVIVSAPAGDTQAPTTPTNLVASAITETTASLSWSASSDNVGVTEYEVFSSGISIGTVTSTGANITGLTANTTYSYTVSAKDAAGNSSNQSNSVTFTTLSSSGGSTVTLHEGFFESGWDGWTDGGSDCYRYSGSRSYEGNRSIRIRDNSGTGSSMTSESFNLTSFDSVEVEFYFYSYSMENGEDFWLRYYNGSSWSTVASWARGSSFENNNYYSATVILNSTDVNFASNSAFRFQNDASGNNDHIYIDQVTIKGIIGNGGNSVNSINAVGNNYNTTTSISNNNFGDDMLYPNPASSILNINPNFGSIKATYRITNLLGQVIKTGTIKNNAININSLKKGIYLIELTDEEETFIQKFIKL